MRLYRLDYGRAFALLFLLLTLLLSVACNIDSAQLDNSVEDALFYDEFVPGSTGNWLTEGDDSAVTAVLNEQMLIEVAVPQTMQFVTLEEPEFSDFALEVDAAQMVGDSENSYGVLFRMQSPVEFYRFDITGNGLYMIERHDSGGWTRFLDDWQSSSAIKQGKGEINRLKVVAEGADLSFYVNDQLLEEVNDGRYLSGNIGLDAGTFGRGSMQASFDNIVVR